MGPFGFYSLLATALLALHMLWADGAFGAALPTESQKYQRDVVREVRAAHGLHGPVALHGALIHQESRWRPDAKSPVGAQGLAQFMPTTSAWMGDVDRRLAGAKPFDPQWSIRAMAVYTAWIHKQVKAADECNAWAFTLSAYNGGLGWVNRDKRLADAAGKDPLVWWGNVEQYSNRASWAIKENRHYPEVIINRWQPLYLRAGWAGPEICSDEGDISESGAGDATEEQASVDPGAAGGWIPGWLRWVAGIDAGKAQD